MWYVGFKQDLDLDALTAASTTGATPLVTWEPYIETRGTTEQPEYQLSRISSGEFDPYLRRWAETARSYGKPFMVRFAHEMNGDWYPWSEARNDNRPGDYVRA
jgi:hypothetical protein